MSFALDFPPPLAALNALEYPYDDDGGIDFEAYAQAHAEFPSFAKDSLAQRR